MKRIRQPLPQRLLWCAAATGMLVFVSAVQAEEATSTEEALPLGTVVITGTLSETLIEESPVPVQVITREAIESSQAATLEDLLADVPGIQLIQTHGQTGSSIQLNGMSEKHVLVLVDGVPLNQANKSNIDTRKVRLANVERIEIVSANASSLYGSSAMGGVVHLITRQAEEPGYEIGVRARQAEASTDRGPTRTDVDGRVVTPLLGGQLASTFSVSQDNGFDRTPETWEDQTDQGLSWSLDERWDIRGDINHSLGVSWSGWDLSRPSGTEPQESTEEYWNLGGQYHGQSESAELILVGSYEEAETHKTSLRTSELWNASADGRLFFDFLGHEQVVGTRVTTAFLGQTNEDSGEAEIEPSDQQSVEAYAQDDWFLGDRWEVVSGIRGHWNEAYGVFWAPNVATRFDLTEQQFLRASVGLGYRVPDIKERFYVFDHSTVTPTYGYKVYGNPDLLPESSLGFQVEWVAGPFSVEYFQRSVKDLIATRRTGGYVDPTDAGRWIDENEYTNIDRANISGINLAVDGELGAHKLAAELQFLRAENVQTGETLARRPEYNLGLNHQWRFSTIRPHRLNTRITHTGPQFFAINDDEEPIQPVDPYTLIDVSLATDLTDSLTLTVGVDNLTDVWSKTNGGEDPLPILGREYLVGLRYAP
ncbi:TonB-dependent receptor plug domain-containing protein [Saccharospirillum mangrovi]|uniref:TonB-dependent receptor plug domain-containing protein n=1 Tax=Saccharospirillum mangrovi TaxID=2161747 RepID=UPI000D3CC8B8|nr:TonB-dependent receptor [Saccharospirillum mangrovi]